jgi:hypothetical protein
MTRLIGIRGGKGAGKDTTADYLVERYGARKYAFADDIKVHAIAAFDLRPEQVWGTQAQKEEIDPRYQLSGRQLMQRIGDGARAAFGDSFWIDRTFAKIFADRPAIAVISDVRRESEAARVWREGTQYAQQPSYVWRLHYAPGRQPPEDLHASEQEWMLGYASYEIRPGDGDLPELYAELDAACKWFGIAPRLSAGA